MVKKSAHLIDFEKCLAPFKDFDFEHVLTWDEFQLHCDLCGVNISHDILRSLMLLACCFSNIHQILCDLIKKEHFCDELLNTTEFAYNLYQSRLNTVYDPNFNSLELWYFDTHNRNLFSYIDDDREEKHRFELETLLDNRFPLIWLKFYEKYKISVGCDRRFISWLEKRLKLKAQYNSTFKRLYDAFLNDSYRRQNIMTHLN